MADGDYERRTAHDAEMKRLERIIRESRERQAETKKDGDCRPRSVKTPLDKPFSLLFRM